MIAEKAADMILGREPLEAVMFTDDAEPAAGARLQA